MTQCEQILTHLKKGRILTSMNAFRLYGISRLAARVLELKHRGHRIESAMVRLPSGARVAAYSL